MSPQESSGAPTMDAPKSGVRVRMYDPGFGDCFLLAFPTQKGGAHYMLIDFGVHHSYPGAEQRSIKVAEEIARATGKHLHTVVVTHEHTDHLRGFLHAQTILNEFEIDDLWLAWTEDPDNKTAQDLEERYGLHVRALDAAARRLDATDPEFAGALRGVLEFEVGAPEVLGATSTPMSEIEFLRSKAKNAPRDSGDYCKPGAGPRCLPGVAGARIYVLGPPEDWEAIRSLEKKSELYPKMVPLDEDTVFAGAVFAAAGDDEMSAEDQDLIERSRPFDRGFEIPEDRVGEHPEADFFQEHYGAADSDLAWRRIDIDWLGAAERLALKIDSKTNNTSLALAIEVFEDEPPGKVLIFAADAQVGNWLSWHDVEWPAKNPDDDPLRVRDLFARTILYKTGHHGSHNATLKAKGLEMMTHPDLVAMVPVDQVWAHCAQGWEHPAHHLYEDLLKRTKGRILRTDRIPGKKPVEQSEEESERERTECRRVMPEEEWKALKTPATEDQWDVVKDRATGAKWKAFKRQLAWDDSPDHLWIEYTVFA